MKNILVFILLAVGVVTSSNLQAQKKDKSLTTVELMVQGVCGMCATRIENAAYIKGVKKVSWNKETGVLSVTFRSDKTNEDKIHESIAKAGHDTNKIKAKEEDYKKLPACCSYKDGVKVH